MNKILAFLQLFKKGKRLVNPAPWKNVQAAAGLLVPVLAGISILLGGDVVTDVQIEQSANYIAYIGVGAYGLFNIVITYITSNKVGM